MLNSIRLLKIAVIIKMRPHFVVNVRIVYMSVNILIAEYMLFRTTNISRYMI